jgi:hypothetical protein
MDEQVRRFKFVHNGCGSEAYIEGDSWISLWKLNLLPVKCPGCRGIIVRSQVVVTDT